MKTMGYLLISLGVAFAILFGLAALGGAHIPVICHPITVMLITGGWNLRKVKNQAKTPATGATPNGNLQLPMTPAIMALISKRRARSKRIIGYVIASGLVFFTAGGTLLALSVKPDDGSSMTGALAVLVAILDVFWAAIVGGIWYFVGDRPTRKDTESEIYVRSSGPVSVSRMATGSMMQMAKLVKVGDRSFVLESLDCLKVLQNLGSGTVDYTPHAHIILAIWDENGRDVYSLDNSVTTPAIR